LNRSEPAKTSEDGPDEDSFFGRQDKNLSKIKKKYRKGLRDFYQEKFHKTLRVNKSFVMKIREVNHVVNFHIWRVFANWPQSLAKISCAQKLLSIFDEKLINVQDLLSKVHITLIDCPVQVSLLKWKQLNAELK